MRKLPQSMRKGFSEFCVLIVVGRAENYGYAILSQLRTFEALTFSESTLYPMLSKMKTEGLLRVREATSKSGRPRRYYRLTRNGSARLSDMTTQWADLKDGIDGLMADGENIDG